MYTYHGQDITELRRAKLRPIAAELGVSGDGTKDEILARIVALAIGRKVLELETPVEVAPVKALKLPPLVVKPKVKPAKAKPAKVRKSAKKAPRKPSRWK